MRWKVLAIPDTHFPFEHRRAMKKLFDETIKEQEFTHIIQLGDLLDQYSFTRFVKRNLYLPHKEIQWGRDKAQKFWDDIKRHQPKAKRIQLLGNHDTRIWKRTQEKLPEAQDIVRDSLLELYKFEGVHTIQDPRQEYYIEGVAYLHGYMTVLGDHCKYMNMSVVHGHRHRGGTIFYPRRKRIIWELDAGYLGDPNKEPNAYQPQKFKNSTFGYGVIDEAGPRFIPINL